MNLKKIPSKARSSTESSRQVQFSFSQCVCVLACGERGGKKHAGPHRAVCRRNAGRSPGPEATQGSSLREMHGVRFFLGGPVPEAGWAMAD